MALPGRGKLNNLFWLPPASGSILISSMSGSLAVPVSLCLDVSTCCFAEAPAGDSHAMRESDSGSSDDGVMASVGDRPVGASAAAIARGGSELSGRSACWTLPRSFSVAIGVVAI